MPIQNFPAALQPIIQQNFLEREFQEGIQSMLSYRSIARREAFPNKIGETVTKTRPGLKAPVTTPITAASSERGPRLLGCSAERAHQSVPLRRTLGC